jgi:hypothetical protein
MLLDAHRQQWRTAKPCQKVGLFVMHPAGLLLAVALFLTGVAAIRELVR